MPAFAGMTDLSVTSDFFNNLVEENEKGVSDLIPKRPLLNLIWWALAELNCGHTAFQAVALPTELRAQ